MTQGSFIQHLHDLDCEVSQDHTGLFYRVRKRYGNHPWSRTTMPINANHTSMKLATICLVCHHLNIEKPSEVREYNEQFFEPVIVRNHLIKQIIN